MNVAIGGNWWCRSRHAETNLETSLKIGQSGASATVVRAILSVLFLGSAIFVIRDNLQQIIENPTLGVDHTYNRRAELVREIEGVDKPGKEEWISLAFGDGMRFFAFLANHLPEDAVLIFPRDDAGYIKPTQYFRIGSGAIKVRTPPA